MVLCFDITSNEMEPNHQLTDGFKAYEKCVNFRFDFMLRSSLVRPPDQLNHTRDYSLFDPAQKVLLECINSDDDENNINKLRKELKKLISELNSKTRDISVITLQEEGVRNNIKQLEDIIVIKESFMEETANFAQIRNEAKNKVQKEYNKVYKKYNNTISQLCKASKSSKTNSNATSSHIEQLSEKINRYEAKIKKMSDVIRMANESRDKLELYQTALQTSRDRLKAFNEQLNGYLKIKQELILFVNSKEKLVKQMKLNLSNLGVLSSIERSRNRTSSNCIENNDLKKDFVTLRNMRNEVLSSRPKDMFNPKYQKNKLSTTKDDMRKYLENEEAIDSIDYLIELKNFENNSKMSLSKFIQMNSNETNILMKCLSALSIDEIKKLLVHYFTKNVNLKESERENDNLIAELDESIIKYKQTILTINNNFQEFHLSIEKKFALLKKHYQDKINLLFAIFQEESNAITVLKLRQEMLSLKKKVIELEKENSRLAKSKIVTVLSEQQYRGLEQLEASKPVSESKSATVTVNKNKLKFKKNKSK